MSGKAIARAVALGRIGFGAVLVAAPERFTNRWLGRDSARAGTQVVARGLGARDIALGVGALSAPTPALQLWVGAAIAADLADFISTVTASRPVPRSGKIGVGALALGGAAMGAAALAGLRRG